VTALRIIFMGTPELARVSLEALLGGEFQIVGVVTQPDRPKGRDLKLTPSPVKELALRSNLPVLQPERARNENFIEELGKLKPDLIVVAAFGQILPQSTLDLPQFGCINVHTSLLPKYRGAAPIQWAILNDEYETGVTIMKMDAGMDTGAILTQEKILIHESDNAQTLHDRLATMGAELLMRTIPDYVAGKIPPRPQPTEGISYAPKIKKQDGQIDWTQPARAIWNRVRGLVPWPGAYTHVPAEPTPYLLKIWEAEPIQQSGTPGQILNADKHGIVVACGQDALRIRQLQLEGGKRLNPQQFLTGHQLRSGQVLSPNAES
jgi:methionyl-tRNA formyltransferase